MPIAATIAIAMIGQFRESENYDGTDGPTLSFHVQPALIALPLDTTVEGGTTL